MLLPDIEELPHTPENVMGIFKFRDEVIPVVCLRSLFGKPSIEEEVKAFSDMMDARKQDHVNWVKEFDRCAGCGAVFTLAADAHQCALGCWYDQYEPDSATMRMQLRRMEEPHTKIHQSVGELEECRKLYKGEEFEKKKQDILDRLEKDYMPKVLSVLEEAKTMYSQDRRTLLIVIDTGETSYAMAVDEVISVEMLSDVSTEEKVEKLKGSTYIKGIRRSPRMARLVFVINDIKLGRMAQDYRS